MGASIFYTSIFFAPPVLNYYLPPSGSQRLPYLVREEENNLILGNFLRAPKIYTESVLPREPLLMYEKIAAPEGCGATRLLSSK